MREASYLALNEKKWRKIEALLDGGHHLSAEESSDLFIELTDDLAYAQTNYPDSTTTKYLNGLSLGIYQRINKSRQQHFKTFLDFWRFTIPAAVIKNHRTLLLVFLFFLFFSLIGAFSTHYDVNYPRQILGDNYVDMTLENIENGDPMNVYKDSGREEMFWGITLNNLRVSALVFVAGIFLCFGSFYLLFTNAVMLGAFQYFFVSKGLFVDSFLTIWIHGTIEISCIIISGTAGVTLGKGFLFPGTLSRKNSFIQKAREGLTIFIGIVPLIILAGFLESFITRLTEASNSVRLLIIVSSAIFVLWYFVIYPVQLKRKTKLA